MTCTVQVMGENASPAHASTGLQLAQSENAESAPFEVQAVSSATQYARQDVPPQSPTPSQTESHEAEPDDSQAIASASADVRTDTAITRK
jgi:hypothetical protein